MNAVVLSNDRSSIVLGVLSEPSSRLISLPRRSNCWNGISNFSSSGKGGGLWAVQHGPRFRGIPLGSLEPSTAPNVPVEGTLTAFATQTDRIGILRLRLLDSSVTWGVANGTWIRLDSQDSEGPSQLQLGNTQLVPWLEHHFVVRPEHGLYAICLLQLIKFTRIFAQ